MFCPNCGSNQTQGRKFCTVCGTNLSLVSQALTGQPPHQQPYIPPVPNAVEIEKQRDLAKGYKLAIIGGGIVAFKLFSFVFSAPWRGGFSIGFWGFIGFVLLATGIAKILSSRTHHPLPEQRYPEPNRFDHRSNLQSHTQQVFSPPTSPDKRAPRTNSLDPVPPPSSSVTEDDTRHLPGHTPPR